MNIIFRYITNIYTSYYAFYFIAYIDRIKNYNIPYKYIKLVSKVI